MHVQEKRDILERIAEKDLTDPQKVFDGWTDSKMVVRGCGYLGNVKEIAANDESLYGAVDGALRYYTKVWWEQGDFESVCTCPVGSRCKHSVALILKTKEVLSKGEAISDSIADEWRSAVDARLIQFSQQVDDRRAADDKRHLEARRAREEEERAAECERRREDQFRHDFANVREALLAACRGDSVEQIKESLRVFLEWADDYELPQHFELSREVGDTVDPTTDLVFASLENLGCTPAEMIFLAYELSGPSGYSEIGRRFDELKSSPSGCYAVRSVWTEVAVRFQGKLASIPEDEYSENDNLSSPWYWNDALRTAWVRGGSVEKAIEVSVKNVTKIGNWKDVVDFLVWNRRYDKAVEIARAGIRAGWESEGCGSDLLLELQVPLAESLSGLGDHIMAAAVLAELFFYEPCVVIFQKMLDEAEKAGCRADVEKAVIHALETGRHPDSIVTWKFVPAVQKFEWKPVPKPVVYHIPTTCPETPPWPLPWANEGVKLFDSRWRDFKPNCQSDMLFLLKLAVVHGDRAEIARRFDNLPEMPNNGGFPLEGEMITLCEAVIGAMRDYRDNIVARLSGLRKSCYVVKEQGGQKCAVRTIRKLGDGSDGTFANWQDAFDM